MADDDVKDAAKGEDDQPVSSKPAPVPALNGDAKEAPAVAPAKPAAAAPAVATAAASVGHAAHGDAHGHGGGHGHGLAHTMPVSMLVGVLGALMALTVLTVAVTSFDLGAQGNLVVAMIIATVKAALVVAFFMHLVWDKKLHLILFLTSVLFLVLFLSLSVNDRGEYQPDIDAFQKASATAK
jgi:cytochrome c oxidase subunit 4